MRGTSGDGTDQLDITAFDEALEFFSFDHFGSLPEPDGASDAACGYGVIARNHDHSNACLLAGPNRLSHVCACWILQTHETNKSQGFVGSGVHPFAGLEGAAQHAQPLMTEQLDPS